MIKILKKIAKFAVRRLILDKKGAITQVAGVAIATLFKEALPDKLEDEVGDALIEAGEALGGKTKS